MGKYVAENTLKQLIKADKQIKGCKIVIMKITFKKYHFDIRNNKLIDNISKLREYRIEIKVIDPFIEKSEMQRKYGIKLSKVEEITDIYSVVLWLPKKYLIT